MESFEKILSVIVPAYNMEAYLPKCLSSLVIDDKQLLRKLDVIVVNDGSKDRTSEIAHEFEAKYPDVFRVMDKANGNYGSCINAALPIAKGVFVKVLDADDTFDNKSFTQMLDVLIDSECNAKHLDLLLTDFVEVDGNNEEICAHTLQLPADKVLSIAEVKRMPLLYMHSIVYRMKNIIDIGYHQTEGISYTDNEWTFYPMVTIRRFQYTRLPVYRYLVGRVGQTTDPVVLKKSVYALSAIAERMNRELGILLTNAEDSIRLYLENVASSMNVRVYNSVILNEYDKEVDQRLITFDCAFASVSHEMHEKIMNQLVFRSLGFKYGVHWRRHQSNNTFSLRLYRFFRRMVKAARLLLHG